MFKNQIKKSTLARAIKQSGYNRNLPNKVFTCFVAAKPNDLWQGDGSCGIEIVDEDGNLKKSFLFAWLDDCSRDIPHAEFYSQENLPRLEDCFKKAILKRGVPKRIFVDNGLIFSAKHFTRICAELGIKKIHSTPYYPESRGKIERFFQTVKDGFLSEIMILPKMKLNELNRYFFIWLEEEYRLKTHSQTQRKPKQHFEEDIEKIEFVDSKKIHFLFLLEEERVVSKRCQVKLFGNVYWVDPIFANRRVEVRYDPFDLRIIWIFIDGQYVGEGKPDRLITLRKAKVDEEVVEKKAVEGAKTFLKILEKKEQEKQLKLFVPTKSRDKEGMCFPLVDDKGKIVSYANVPVRIGEIIERIIKKGGDNK